MKKSEILYEFIKETLCRFTYSKRKKQLKNILLQAQNIIDASEVKTGRNHPIFSFVASISKMIFFNNLFLLNSTFKRDNDYESYLQEMGLFEKISPDCYKISNILQINLAGDAVLSFPWRSVGLVKCLAKIGSNVNNSFEYQSNNHFSKLLMPLGLTMMYNGLHSTSSGIVKGEGSINITSIVNLSQNCKDFYFDGLYIRKYDDNTKVHLVKHFEAGVLFELSRLIQKNNIDFLAGIDIQKEVYIKKEIDREWRIYTRNNTKILHYCVYDDEGECELEVIGNTIIFTTTSDSFGLSTTNAAEYITDYVAKKYGIPLKKVICYEHYLCDKSIDREIINRISFDIKNDTLINPHFIPGNLPIAYQHSVK